MKKKNKITKLLYPGIIIFLGIFSLFYAFKSNSVNKHVYYTKQNNYHDNRQKINHSIPIIKKQKAPITQIKWSFSREELKKELLNLFNEWGEMSFFVDEDLVQHVCYFYKYYSLRNRANTNKTIIRSKKYLPQIIDIFKNQGVPEDIAFAIPYVESSFNNNARSKSKAVGMFQFMKRTAREYGLRVRRNTDQRKNFKKAANACASYIKKNKNLFASFVLSLGSYHHGTGAVIKVLKTSKDRSFRSIFKSRYLGKYSKEYIPQCLAAVLIYRFLKKQNLKLIPEMKINSKKIIKSISIKHLKNKYPMIHRFNPDLKGVSKTYLYATTKGYVLIKKISINKNEITEHLSSDKFDCAKNFNAGIYTESFSFIR